KTKHNVGHMLRPRKRNRIEPKSKLSFFTELAQYEISLTNPIYVNTPTYLPIGSSGYNLFIDPVCVTSATSDMFSLELAGGLLCGGGMRQHRQRSSIMLSLLSGDIPYKRRCGQMAIGQWKGSTLIICSNRMLYNWEKMLEGFVFVSISCHEEHSQLTLTDLMNARVVLVTASYFFGCLETESDDLSTYYKLYRQRVLNFNKTEEECALHSFWWNRIIIDEVQDTVMHWIHNPPIRYYLLCDYLWAINSEVVSIESFRELAPLFIEPSECVTFPFIGLKAMYDQCVHVFAPLLLEEEVSKELLTADFTIMCELTPDQTLFYNGLQTDGMRQFCAYPEHLPITFVTLEQAMLRGTALLEEEAEESDTTNQSESEDEDNTSDEDYVDENDSVREVVLFSEDGVTGEVDELVREIDLASQPRETASQLRAKQFAETVELLSGAQVNPECGICCTNVVNVIMTCSHMLCSSCAFRLQEGDQPCPYCRREMTCENVFYLKCGTTHAWNTGQSKLEQLCALIQSGYMKTVVFIQWFDLAHFVEKEMKKRNFNVRIFDRTDRRMAKTLRWFDNRKVNNRVLVVPLFYSNCVFQIPSVQRVVYYHALTGPNASAIQMLERRSLECVCPTAELEVYHLITRDTIECT
nr:RING-HC finger protein [Gammaproteobacteria bacterium]